MTLAITSVLALGAVTFLANADQANRLQSAISGLNVSGRFGLDQLSRDIRMSGYRDSDWTLGALATVAQVRPRNLAIVVLDNERFGETGGQPTHTAGAADLAAIARGAGFATAGTVRGQDEIAAMTDDVYGTPGPVFYAVKIAYEALENIMPPLDGAYAKDRFRVALLGAKAGVGGA